MRLRLDVDRRAPLPLGRMVWLLARAGYRLRWVSQRRSPSGRGWHVEALTRPAIRSCVEVAALQAVLGSDPARESCNVHRARMVDSGRVTGWWASRWNVLYRGE